MLKAICHLEDKGWTEVDDLSTISELVQGDGNVVWAEVDLKSHLPHDTDMIAEEFGLHPLAVEDAFSLRQRPKFEAYENHLFAVFHQIDEEDGQFEVRQIACFIGKGWVLSIHDHADRTLNEVGRRLKAQPKPRERGPSHVMHTLLDVIVDGYQANTDRLEDQVEDLEEHLLARPDSPVEKQLYSLKQRLARLRRYAVPGERILSAMLAPTATSVPDETGAYFRDIHDHLLRITDQMRNVEDLTNALIDLRRIEQGNALNEVTKRLTGWAAIIAVPTLVTGYYGMNVPFPGSGHTWGWLTAVGLCIACSLTLYTLFRKHEWL